MTSKTIHASASDIRITEATKARVLAIVFSAIILFTTGFAASTPVHNAAHDTRHTLAFPCH